MPVSAKPAKLREAQLQLQRKLQQREHIKDQKRRHHLDTIIQVYIILSLAYIERRFANRLSLYFFLSFFLSLFILSGNIMQIFIFLFSRYLISKILFSYD